MVSAMQARKISWGMVIIAEQMKAVNKKRAWDGQYFDKEADKDVLATK